MTIKVALHALLMATAPPGKTFFSVEKASDCSTDAAECEGARRSSFYGTWVRQESEATGAKRYELIGEALDAAVHNALCVRWDGSRGCNENWSIVGMTGLVVAIGTYESGWREDVQVGRGKNGKPSDDGGQGRGPGGERCFMQIHPTVRDDDRLLGTGRDALERCFAQAISMLIHARRYCEWKAPKVDPLWATVSMYGTGSSCNSVNHGKTALRVNLARKMIAQLRGTVKR